ncbi:MAG: iron ABC transporter permease [Desulfobacterales bacterium]|nr:iron ABC transporter permease [Pseudomonadota bacterium]MBU4356546.1 iron ABC transporter permease [Pseudomonadota bacterium]MCG2773307.1 iron ABC transporter permease [Desulfobacterales bacterium]
MSWSGLPLARRLLWVAILGGVLLAISLALGMSLGSTPASWRQNLAALLDRGGPEDILTTIIWRIRWPRALLAGLVGATLSLGGLVFQALLRNPLADPYILGVSGGSAVGAILGLLAGLAPFPGVALLAFLGSMCTLLLVLVITSGEPGGRKGSLLLAGVMVNAFCSAVIIFLVSITQDARLHNILYWLMGDLSMSAPNQTTFLIYFLLPCFLVVLCLARPLNLLLMGEETALYLGLNVALTSRILLVVTSLMVSLAVCQSGLVGFVGLVVPHLFRLILGPDHRLLIPACLLGGGSFLILCDLVSRVLPSQGEMPVGVITAMVGAPLFVLLLMRSR